MKSIEFLKSKECLEFIALLLPKRTTDVGKISLFERFCLLCDNLQYLKKSFISEELLENIAKDTDREICIDELIGREAQKAVWREICGAERVVVCKKETFSEAEVPAPIIDLRETKDIFQCLCSTREQSLDKLLERISNDTDLLLLDLEGFVYSRPDPYHSEITYEKLLNGERCEQSDISALICWSICRILMRRNMELYVNVSHSNDLDSLVALIKLLESRKLFPKIVLCINSLDSDGLDVLVQICLDSQEKNIFFALDERQEILRSKLLYKLPSNRIFALK